MKKENEVKEYKEEKRGLRIKESNLKKALLEEEKAIKGLTEEYERVRQ